MYLHQGLIDNLLLHTRILLPRLRSIYTYRITNKNKKTELEWYYNYNPKPNVITKIRYQRKFYRKGIFFLMNKTRWDYIKGPTKLDYDTMKYTVGFGSVEMFKLCLNNNTIPDQFIINKAAFCGKIQIFELCLNINLKPNQETMNYSACHGHIEIFKKCLEYVKPTQDTMDIAIELERSEMIEIIKQII